MPDISRIKLPSGNYYDIKDAVAREMISGGVSFIVGWDGTSTPDATKIPAGVKVTYNSTEYTGTLATTTAQAGAFYLVKSSTQAGIKDAYDEYVVVKPDTSDSTTWYWEKIGDTQIDLTDVVTDVDLSKQTDVVLGEATTFTNGSSTVTLGTPTKDNVLGEDTTFTATASGGNVALNSTYLSAEGNGTASVVTGYTPSSDTFLKSASAETSKLVTASITPVNGTESVSKVTKTASKLVTTSITPTDGTESVSKVTKTASKLVTTSITPTNGTESVSKVTKTASKLVTTNVTGTNGTDTASLVSNKVDGKLVTTTIPNVTGNTSVSIPNVTGNTSVTASKISSNSSVTANKSNWSFTMGTASGETETLIIGGGNGSDVTATNTAYSDVTASNTTLGTALSASKVTLGTAITAATGAVASTGTGSAVVSSFDTTDKTLAKVGSAVTVATGSVASTGTGSDIVTAVTISDKTVAKAGSAVTVATGEVDANGTGTDIITGVTISDKTVAKAGSAVTVATGAVNANGAGSDIVTGVTISDKTVAKAGTAITVATGEVDEEGTGSDIVTGVTVGTTATALTGLGTPTKSTVLTGVKLQSNNSTATGRVQVITGKGTVTQPTITVTADTNDIVSAVTALPTSGNTAAAQTITVGTNDKVTVLKSTTDVSVTKGNQ